jgi:hypothetical protein
MVYHYYSEAIPFSDRMGILLGATILAEADQICCKTLAICGFNLLDQILN